MLRNALLAGAAALALLPAIGAAQAATRAAAADAAQTSPSETSGVATPGGSTTPYSSQVPSSSQDATAPDSGTQPGASSDQPAAPPSAQQPPADQGANPAPGYYTSPGAQTAPEAQPPADQGGMDMNRSGSTYTAQPPAAAQPQYGTTTPPAATGQQPYGATTPPSAEAQPQTSTSGGLALNSDQPVVVAPRTNVSARMYVRRAAMADNYEIRAAHIALQRSQSDTVRQFANDMIQQHSQSTAILTQAANQANVPVNSRLDRSHRAMLIRLERAPAADFDRIYMNQQLTAHMDAASLHQGYAQSGDNPALQQAAQQISPTVQQHLNLAWADSGVPQRLAEQRNNELTQLAEASPRGGTYRGYTVIGPRSARQLREENRTTTSTGYTDQYTGGGGAAQVGYTGAVGEGQSSGGAASGAAGTPQYQGYTSSQGYTSGYTTTQPAPGAAPPGTATPGAPGTVNPNVNNPNVTNPNTNPNMTGAPQYQGYTSPGATQPPSSSMTPGTSTGTTNPNVTGTPQYQGYTSGAPGSAAPGAYPSTTTPGTTSPGYTAPEGSTYGAPPPGTTPPAANPPGSASSSAATPPAGAAGPR